MSLLRVVIHRLSMYTPFASRLKLRGRLKLRSVQINFTKINRNRQIEQRLYVLNIAFDLPSAVLNVR